MWEAIGRVEYYLSAVRDPVVGVLGIGVGMIGAWSGAGVGHGLMMVALVLVSRQARRYANDRAVRQLLREPDAHPADFWATWQRAISPWPPVGEIATRSVQPDLVDFTDRPRPRWPLSALLHAQFDTANVAWLMLHGERTLSQAEFLRVFDSGTRMWSLRSAWHFRVRLEVEGLEAIEQVEHQAIVLFNHESLLDFALGFYVLGGVETRMGRRIRARFLAAKDHFYDNWILHTALGIGRAMVAAGMIFVDRSSKGAGASVVTDSVVTLQRFDVDLALFPQGTRARAHFDADGRPVAGGYYTTSRVAGRRHFRRGGAAIAAGLSRRQPVDVLCVAILGTARVIPTRTRIVQTHQTIRYRVLPPVRLDRGDEVDESALLRRCELLLRQTARVNERLLEGWARDLERDESDRAAVAAALNDWDEAEEPIPFAALDLILTRPLAVRRPLLERFEAMALEGADEAAWDALRTEVQAA